MDIKKLRADALKKTRFKFNTDEAAKAAIDDILAIAPAAAVEEVAQRLQHHIGAWSKHVSLVATLRDALALIRSLSLRVAAEKRAREEAEREEERAALKAAEAHSAALARALEDCIRLWDKYYQALPLAQFPDVENEEFGEVLRARSLLAPKEDTANG